MVHHGWPFLEFLRHVRESGRDVVLAPLEYVAHQVLNANPASLPVWLAGLGWLLLSRRGRAFRPLGTAFLVTLATFILTKGKDYYVTPAFATLFAAGGVALEGWTAEGWRSRLRPAFVLLYALTLPFLPFVLPLLSPERLIAYQEWLGFNPAGHREGPRAGRPAPPLRLAVRVGRDDGDGRRHVPRDAGRGAGAGRDRRQQLRRVRGRGLAGTEVRPAPEGPGLYPDGNIPFTRDYQKEFYDNSTPSYEFGANFSGGSQGTLYYVNLTQRKENGTAPNIDAQLQALRTNFDQSFANGKFKVNVGLNVTRNTLQRGLSNNDNTCTSPIYCFLYTPGVINLDSITPSGLYVRNPFNGGGAYVSNPFETFEYLRLVDQTFRQIGNASGTWSALSQARNQVSVTLAGGFDRAQTSGDVFSPSFLQYENPAATDGFSGRSVRTEGNIFNYNVSLVANWGWQPMDGLSLTTTGGASFESSDIRVVDKRYRAARTALPHAPIRYLGL